MKKKQKITKGAAVTPVKRHLGPVIMQTTERSVVLAQKKALEAQAKAKK